jgi:hypothetical protein
VWREREEMNGERWETEAEKGKRKDRGKIDKRYRGMESVGRERYRGLSALNTSRHVNTRLCESTHGSIVHAGAKRRFTDESLVELWIGLDAESFFKVEASLMHS